MRPTRRPHRLRRASGPWPAPQQPGTATRTAAGPRAQACAAAATRPGVRCRTVARGRTQPRPGCPEQDPDARRPRSLRRRSAARAHRGACPRGARCRCRPGAADRSRSRSRRRRQQARPRQAARCRAHGREKLAKAATSPKAMTRGARQPSAMARPSASTDSAMPVSTKGSGRPAMPSTPPTMISGKATGSIQINGAPRNAPQIPTATIASR